MADLFGWRRPRHRSQFVRTYQADAPPLEYVDPGHAWSERLRERDRIDRDRLYGQLQTELAAGGYAKDDPDMNERIAQMYAQLEWINRRHT